MLASLRESASWSGSAGVAISDAANATVTDDSTGLASMTVTLTSPHTGDVLAANTTVLLLRHQRH